MVRDMSTMTINSRALAPISGENRADAPMDDDRNVAVGDVESRIGAVGASRQRAMSGIVNTQLRQRHSKSWAEGI